ncbi:Aste57867_11443 [Aphanomyces stellatus]|uniref:Aste57867_11443 protein n=1 Tax=Aphanomyces stellatus TaxID=120398 RepID=A0A485KT10_9STRA|nr:hypothetical protein As57867_011401 [Aphanomyces stellatus]VFT88304.1 Aste57867_11443 [Aphanomyces stellatus]
MSAEIHHRRDNGGPPEEEDSILYVYDNNDKPSTLYAGGGWKVPESVKNIYTSFVTAMLYVPSVMGC